MLHNPYDPSCGPCDMAFTMYAEHREYLNSIVDRIVAGETELEVRDSVSELDLQWIQREVERRLG